MVGGGERKSECLSGTCDTKDQTEDHMVLCPVALDTGPPAKPLYVFISVKLKHDREKKNTCIYQHISILNMCQNDAMLQSTDNLRSH